MSVTCDCCLRIPIAPEIIMEMKDKTRHICERCIDTLADGLQKEREKCESSES